MLTWANGLQSVLEEENEERLANPEIGKVWEEEDGPVDFTPVANGY